MLNPELWTIGLTTMLVGMGVVFTFLTITVFAINIMANIIAYIDKICPPVIPEVKTKKKQSTDESEIALAIALAKVQ